MTNDKTKSAEKLTDVADTGPHKTSKNAKGKVHAVTRTLNNAKHWHKLKVENCRRRLNSSLSSEEDISDMSDFGKSLHEQQKKKKYSEIPIIKSSSETHRPNVLQATTAKITENEDATLKRVNYEDVSINEKAGQHEKCIESEIQSASSLSVKPKITPLFRCTCKTTYLDQEKYNKCKKSHLY